MSAWKNRGFAARLRYALQGFAHALSQEHSLRAQSLAFLGVLVVLALLRPGALWWALLLLASSGVLAAELLNSAIERLADALHPADSPAIRAVKDCAAAGVLLAVLGALAVGAAFLAHLLGAPA